MIWAFVVAIRLLGWRVMLNRDPFRLVAGDRRLLAPVAIAGVWTVVAMVAAVQAVALVRLGGRTNMADVIVGRLSILPLWALATPLILRSARRFAMVDRNGHVSVFSAALHLVLGSLFIVITTVVTTANAQLSPQTPNGRARLLTWRVKEIEDPQRQRQRRVAEDHQQDLARRTDVK